MKLLTFLYSDIIKRPSLYLFVFIAFFSIDRHHRFECAANSNGPFYSDVFEYYSFLPEYFLDHALVPAQNFSSTRRTVGMAIMYAPGFFAGHLLAGFTDQVQDGYSLPYQQAIRWGSILYSILGLWFCRKSLVLFFTETVTAIALACVFFGTNLFYYTFGNGEFPHSYLFFLNAIFLYFTLKWIREKKYTLLLPLGLISGMIVLIRPTGILVFLFPLLFDIHSVKDFVARVKLLILKPLITIGALGLFLVPLLIQAFIWKKYHGQFIYYSYKDEHFFFNDPQIRNFLISFRKGWLIYTPIMVFSLAGIILSWKKLRSFFLFLVIYFSVSVYILSSWWDWGYGGSFGCRALVESYAFLVFPFAVFVSWIWDLKKEKTVLKNVIRISLLFIFYLLIELNIFQTRQYKYGHIHWSGMNYETYKYVFLRNRPKQEYDYLYTRFTPPNAEEMKHGKRNQ